MNIARAAGAIILIAAWQIAAIVTHGYIPGPLSVAKVFADPEFLRILARAYAATAPRAILGYIAGLTVGLLVGVVAVLLRVSRGIEPLASVLASVPSVAWIPLLIALIGADEFKLPVLAAFMCALPPILYEVINAVSSLDPEEIGVARSLGARGIYLWRTIILPHIIERVFPAAKIEAAMVWKTVFVAEMVAVPSGLGYLAMIYADLLDLAHLIAVIMVLSATIACIVHLLSLTEERLLARRGLGVSEEWLSLYA